MNRNRIFSSPNTENKHGVTLKDLVHKSNFHHYTSFYKILLWYSYITTLAIWVYNEKAVVFSDISNPNTCISKIIDIIRQVVEWSEIAFSGRQNTENEHFETLKKLVHKLNFHHWTCLYKTFNLLFVFYYSSNLNLQWESGRLCRYF